MRWRRAAAAGCAGLLAAAAGCARADRPDEWAAFRAAAGRAGAEALAEGRMVVPGRDGWLFLASELRHLGAGPFWGEAAAAVTRASRPDFADPLPPIVDFHRQLAGAGIRLVFVPVPPKAAVYPDGLDGDVGAAAVGPGTRVDAEHRRFYELLRAEGVEVLDLAPLFLAARAGGEPPLYCRQDSHWSGRACVLAARAIAAAVEPHLPAGRPRQAYEAAEREVEIRGDLWTALGDPDAPRERLTLRFVSEPGGGGRQPVAADPDSPVLLLGDSHTLVFHAGTDLHAVGAGLADQLALELGLPVDVIGVRGSGATPSRLNLMRRARANPDYLAGKRVVVWCFSAREFTEGSGWRIVPLGP